MTITETAIQVALVGGAHHGTRMAVPANSVGPKALDGAPLTISLADGEDLRHTVHYHRSGFGLATGEQAYAPAGTVVKSLMSSAGISPEEDRPAAERQFTEDWKQGVCELGYAPLEEPTLEWLEGSVLVGHGLGFQTETPTT
jgi:hypothetical protein